MLYNVYSSHCCYTCIGVVCMCVCICSYTMYIQLIVQCIFSLHMIVIIVCICLYECIVCNVLSLIVCFTFLLPHPALSPHPCSSTGLLLSLVCASRMGRPRHMELVYSPPLGSWRYQLREIFLVLKIPNSCLNMTDMHMSTLKCR